MQGKLPRRNRRILRIRTAPQASSAQLCAKNKGHPEEWPKYLI
jgi:hypothetical protein